NYYGYELATVQAAIDVNKRQKTVLYRKAARNVITFEGLKVAVLGLTFKPGTDDLREAPSIDNIRLLLKDKANIYAYDPIGAENYKKLFPDSNINYVASPEEALEQANICFIFTEWEQIKSVKPDTYKQLMMKPLVYDGRNIYSPQEMKKAGVEYYSVGR
ncbi:MAG TPA: UDP-glucose 6-dehydrogenase, partial [Ruminococcaceae bacterium]|nr:UDP-glucose 6-dehydrogenase [Oscillospiraceae bacterium]